MTPRPHGGVDGHHLSTLPESRDSPHLGLAFARDDESTQPLQGIRHLAIPREKRSCYGHDR